jgi:glycosyltransferase involved in cell wall biosynthesis
VKKLKILLAFAQAPLPEGSAAGRWFHVLLRSLVERGHRVSAFAACRSASQARAALECFPAPKYNLRCYPGPRGHGALARLQTLRRPHSYPFSAEMLQDWRVERLRDYDIVQLEDTWSAWLESAPGAADTILNVHNLYQLDWIANPANKEEVVRRALTVRTERKLIRNFPNLVTVSSALAGAISRMAPQSPADVVPFALDPARYEFTQAGSGSDPVIALIGSMDWPPSRSAAERLLRRLWPVIRRRMPNARLQITGRGARQALGYYLAEPGVETSQDVVSTEPFFRQASVLLYAPESGSGIKVKVLEAFAYGLPVVSTPAGVEGLEVRDGVHAAIHTSDDGLVDHTLALLNDPVRREEQRCAARRLLESHYSPTPVMERLESVYAAVLSRTGRRQVEVSEQYAGRC